LKKDSPAVFVVGAALSLVVVFLILYGLHYNSSVWMVALVFVVILWFLVYWNSRQKTRLII
jgi:uncharacterized protein (DUF983 family)